MRVLLVHNRYRVAGGEERHLDLLEEGLQLAGVDVYRLEATSPTNPSALARLRLAAGLIYRLSAARELGSIVSTYQPDVVHVHNLMPALSPAVLREARKTARVVMTVHNYRLVCPAGTLLRRGRVHDDCVTGSSLLCGLRGAREPWYEGAAYGLAIAIHRRLRLVERWVDAFIAPSAAVAQVLERAGLPSRKITVIPYGVPATNWAARRRTHGLFAGRLSPEKGIATLLEAIRLAPEVPVYVAGDGPLAPEAADVLGHRYLGSLRREELTRWQRGAAFSVLPSEWPDVLPFSAIESLAVGTPVAASAIGGLTELVASPGCGELLPPGDAHALAGAMRRLWAQANSEPDYGRGAWESARRRYDLVRQTSAVIEVYEGRTGKQ